MNKDAPVQELSISFVDVSVAEANVLATDLADAIADSDNSVSVTRQRADDTTQDFGSTLAVVLAAPAAVAVARGIQYWLMKHQSVRIEIRKGDCTVVVEGITPKDAEPLAVVLRAFFEK